MTQLHFLLTVLVQTETITKKNWKNQYKEVFFKLIFTWPLIQPAQTIVGSQGLNLKQRMSSGASSSNYGKKGYITVLIHETPVWHKLTCKGTNIFKDVKKCHEIGEGAHKTFRISQFPQEFRRGIGKTGCIFLGQFKSVKYLKRVIINDVLAYFFISMEIPFRGIPIFSYFFQFSKETSILIKNSFSI